MCLFIYKYYFFSFAVLHFSFINVKQMKSNKLNIGNIIQEIDEQIHCHYQNKNGINKPKNINYIKKQSVVEAISTFPLST